MLVYWILFLYFAIGAAAEQANHVPSTGPEYRAPPGYSGLSKALLRFGLVLSALVIGLRYQVGADWRSYELIFHASRLQTFSDLTTRGDPGYNFLNTAAHTLGADLWFVNLVCGVIVAVGILRFAEAQQRPWLTVLVSVPYLMIVVAMGYTRQGASIGFILMGLASYIRTGSIARVVTYVIVAALFHRTAVVVLPFIAVGNEKGRVIRVLVALAVTYVLYTLFLSNALGRYISNYIDTHYASEGAGIRVAMDFVAGALFFIGMRRLDFSLREFRIWRNLALVALVLPALLMVIPSSTAVDRVALYIIPLQLAVLSRPQAVFPNEGIGTALIILYLAAVQFTWLNFAHHAPYWVPYHFWPF